MILVMDEETKKRKSINIIDDEEEEDEDVKMEKFFALIRSAKDIRDRLLDTEESRPPVPAKAVAKSEKKAVAKSEKRAEVVKVHRKDKSLVISQNIASKPDVNINRQSSSSAVASASGGECGGSGGGGSSKASIEEEKEGKKSADCKNKSNYQQGGRVFLDLNLSL